jgi:hypothetical protein
MIVYSGSVFVFVFVAVVCTVMPMMQPCRRRETLRGCPAAARGASVPPRSRCRCDDDAGSAEIFTRETFRIDNSDGSYCVESCRVAKCSIAGRTICTLEIHLI